MQSIQESKLLTAKIPPSVMDTRIQLHRLCNRANGQCGRHVLLDVKRFARSCIRQGAGEPRTTVPRS
jgi:hypothetical protein